MTIKDVLAKISKGEVLTDEDKAIITDYDPDKAVNSSAAAARKSAEAKLKEKESELQKLQDAIEAQRAEAEEKANANKPELEKLTKEMEKLKKGLADKETSVQQLIQEKRQMVRGGRIGRIMAGLKFVEGLDPEIVRLGIEKALAQIGDEDLESEDTINPILEAFKSKNKALLADTSGHGGGSPRKSEGGGAVDKMTMENIKNMSPEEFLKNKDAIWGAEMKGELK